MEQEGVAVLTVQRLDISPAGLLKLKLFQKAGNLLLQSLELRQSSEVISLCTDTPRARDTLTTVTWACIRPSIRQHLGLWAVQYTQTRWVRTGRVCERRVLGGVWEAG